MKTNYILIDYENVAVKSLALLKGSQFRVYVFLGPKNSKIGSDLAIAMQQLGSHAEYIKLDAPGHNALDFHITYYLGKLTATDPNGVFYIISKDTGFDSLIKHLQQNSVVCIRATSIEALPGMPKATAQKVVVKNVAKVPLAKPMPVANSTPIKSRPSVKFVLDNLQKQKSAKPRTEATLRSTIHNWCRTKYSEKEMDAVFAFLVKTGCVIVDGTKVSYKLP